jgi:hypothetical protein
MAFRIRITVFGGSLPSDPSGKVNFMNERGVVSLVAWPEAAGDVAARYRPRAKTQRKLENKRFMDMCSQLTQDTGHSEGAAAIMLVLHDDAKREYAYGLPKGFPNTRVGIFTQDLYDEAKKDGWIVISMKNDWKRIFGFENSGRYVRSRSLADLGVPRVGSGKLTATPCAALPPRRGGRG